MSQKHKTLSTDITTKLIDGQKFLDKANYILVHDIMFSKISIHRGKFYLKAKNFIKREIKKIN